MAKLRVAVLGLDRLSMSMALRLRTYVEKGGQHRFDLIGHESRDDFEKAARKLKVLDKVERKSYDAAAGADLVIMNLPYEDMSAGYEIIAPSLREGAVILDTAPIKTPSLAWAADCLSEEQHWIGFTPAVSAEYLFAHELSPEHASDDTFTDSAIFLTPAASCMPEAIDLAVNFSLILGGKPHFLDPAEHDSLTTLTEELPQVLSIAAFSVAMRHSAWGDAQRLTNPPFNVLTRYLFTHHPDALRDEWMANRAGLVRALDEMSATLRQLRERLADDDESAVEAFIIAASDEYQGWINRRHKGAWDEDATPSINYETSFADSLFGSALRKHFFGGRDGDK